MSYQSVVRDGHPAATNNKADFIRRFRDESGQRIYKSSGAVASATMPLRTVLPGDCPTILHHLLPTNRRRWYLNSPIQSEIHHHDKCNRPLSEPVLASGTSVATNVFSATRTVDVLTVTVLCCVLHFDCKKKTHTNNALLCKAKY